MWESIIKVNVEDDPDRRARDIVDGLSYACALLHDEYSYTVWNIQEILERLIDTVHDDYSDEVAS